MFKLRKLISSILTAVFTVIILLPPNQAARAGSLSPTPAKIDAQYTFKDEIKFLPEAITYNKSTRSLSYSKKSNFNPSVGQIYVDNVNKTAFKIKAIKTDTKGICTAITDSPQLSEIFKNFNIPLQTVKPNKGNIVKLHNGVEITTLYSPTASSDNNLFIAGENIDNVHRFDLTDFVLFELGDPGSANYIKAAVNGYIEFKMPAVTVAANMWNYKLDFSASELSELELNVDAKFNKDIEVPIFAYVMEFDVGSANVGVFLHCNVNGELDIIVKVDQGVSLDAGIYGDSCFYIPYNINSYFNSDHWFNVTPKIDARIEARIAVRVKANLEILDISIGLRMDLGIKGNAAVSMETDLNGNVRGKKLDLSISAFLDIGGGLLGKDYTIYNNDWKIYESHEKYTEGYNIAIKEADAYTNTISGEITQGANKDPYTGNVKLIIKHSNGSTNNKTVSCTNGKFVLTPVITLPVLLRFNLLPQDTVKAAVTRTVNNREETVAESDEVSPTIPISKIEIAYADAFNDIIKGTVSGGYTGLVTIVATTPSASSPANPVKRLIQAACNNGQFSCSTPVTSNQIFSAYIDYEGKHIVSPNAYPSLPFKINLATNATGTRGTIQNLHGIKRYNGKVTIYYTDDDPQFAAKYKKAKMGTVTAMLLQDQKPEQGVTASSSTRRPNLTQTNIPVASAAITQFFRNSSSQFTFNGVKEPAGYFNYEKHVFAVIEYEGIKQEQMYTINPSLFPIPDPAWEFNINISR